MRRSKNKINEEVREKKKEEKNEGKRNAEGKEKKMTVGSKK